MNLINHISKYKSFILIVGMVAALSIIAQPVLKSYADCEVLCELVKEGSETSEEGKKEIPNETQISTLQAVTPTAQMQFAPLDFVLADQLSVETPTTSTITKLAISLPEKLLRVLFNMIIAPNAP